MLTLCGSGLKYKKCCGLHPNAVAGQKRRKAFLDNGASLVRKARADAYRDGKGRGIVSAEFQGARYVAVDRQIHGSTKWKTFKDFLFDYPRILLGGDWGRAELAKPESDRHQIFQWFTHVCNCQKEQTPGPDGIYQMKADGITFSYIAFAYDLYVLRHNQKLQERMIHRLKHSEQFQGARYELTVAATLVRAGFDLDFEDESDGKCKHPESATCSFI
jgi:hypothetical protein